MKIIFAIWVSILALFVASVTIPIFVRMWRDSRRLTKLITEAWQYCIQLQPMDVFQVNTANRLRRSLVVAAVKDACQTIQIHAEVVDESLVFDIYLDGEGVIAIIRWRDGQSLEFAEIFFDDTYDYVIKNSSWENLIGYQRTKGMQNELH